MKIQNIGNIVGSQAVQKNVNKRGTAPADSKPADKVEISSKGRGLQQTETIKNAASAAMNDVPEVREDKVNEVRQRIEEGYYDKPEVKQELAGRILGELGL